MASSLSRYYSAGSSSVCSFGVVDGDGKSGVDPSNIHLYSPKVDCWIYGGDFVSSKSIYYSSMSNSNKDRSFSSLYI